jgi:hypothetical protein
MPVVKIKLKAGNYEIELEGEEEFVNQKISEFYDKTVSQKSSPPIIFGQADLSDSQRFPISPEGLGGIMEPDSQNKPRLVIANPTKKLSLSEVMMLFLYAYDPQKLMLKDLQKIVAENYRSIPITSLSGVMATTLKGRVIKDGKHGNYLYSLSGSGREFVGDILKRLKGGNEIQ